MWADPLRPTTACRHACRWHRGASDRADRPASELAAAIATARKHAPRLPWRPGVHFGEWDDPMISGIAWVSELIETAGGIDVFADRASCKSAKDRIVTAEEVIRCEPHIIAGSWCGKKFRPEKVAERPRFDRMAAGHFLGAGETRLGTHDRFARRAAAHHQLLQVDQLGCVLINPILSTRLAECPLRSKGA